MSVTNQEVAKQLRHIYQLMQLAGENRFRAIAFDKAAQTIEGLGEEISTYIENDNLTDIKGIGSSIAEDIKSYAETGKITILEKLKSNIPEDIIAWLDISGLGPKNIAKIHKELGITRIEELKEACQDGRVAALGGLGEKSAEKILKSIEWMEQFEERCRLDQAAEIATQMLAYLENLDGVEQIEVAGSLRRSYETIGDIDILIGAKKEKSPSIFEAFTGNELVVEILGRGETKSSVRTSDGRQVDLRIVSPEQFPAALMYFTGSKEHNVVMRQRARDRGMSLNEYGLFKLTGDGESDFSKPVNYQSEADIFEHLDLHFIPPELREDRGEFELYEDRGDIGLIEEPDICGVLHAHSTWSDGKYTIAQMAEACMARGYEYLGISDHSRTAAYAGGLSEDEVRQQWEEIDRLNESFSSDGKNFCIFKGIESDILSDGSLDYEDDLLEGFDFVIASVHSGLNLPKADMMKRFRNAIENPFTRIVGHPTGRLLLKRDGSELDMNELIDLAAECNTAIEINANPLRLDLDWRHGNKAREVGLLSSINPDAHTTDGIDYISYGVRIARKAKFDKERILNAWKADKLNKWFEERN